MLPCTFSIKYKSFILLYIYLENRLIKKCQFLAYCFDQLFKRAVEIDKLYLYVCCIIC